MCKFGDLFYADLPILADSKIQQGKRPVMVVSNDLNNQHSSVISIVPLTGHLKKTCLPTHVPINGYGLNRPSIVLAEQIQTLDKSRLLCQIGTVADQDKRREIQKALMVQLNMTA
ncbi:type II toxin-antitoxin system PemK/MazF family toxin [Dehalobacter restrictus]|uniref:type II toxin-antitoxin system PemK/MazF family toxin n=1 Tax=Dehalobacter restrictus TaxID=55583 RepID=UPI00338E0DD6